MLIQLLITLVVWGLIFYVVDTLIPMAPPFKIAVRVLMAVILIVFILDAAHLGHVRYMGSLSFK